MKRNSPARDPFYRQRLRPSPGGVDIPDNPPVTSRAALMGAVVAAWSLVAAVPLFASVLLQPTPLDTQPPYSLDPYYQILGTWNQPPENPQLPKKLVPADALAVPPIKGRDLVSTIVSSWQSVDQTPELPPKFVPVPIPPGPRSLTTLPLIVSTWETEPTRPLRGRQSIPQDQIDSPPPRSPVQQAPIIRAWEDTGFQLTLPRKTVPETPSAQSQPSSTRAQQLHIVASWHGITAQPLFTSVLLQPPPVVSDAPPSRAGQVLWHILASWDAAPSQPQIGRKSISQERIDTPPFSSRHETLGIIRQNWEPDPPLPQLSVQSLPVVLVAPDSPPIKGRQLASTILQAWGSVDALPVLPEKLVPTIVAPGSPPIKGRDTYLHLIVRAWEIAPPQPSRQRPHRDGALTSDTDIRHRIFVTLAATPRMDQTGSVSSSHEQQLSASPRMDRTLSASSTIEEDLSVTPRIDRTGSE